MSDEVSAELTADFTRIIAANLHGVHSVTVNATVFESKPPASTRSVCEP